jgi:hypothetical protein
MDDHDQKIKARRKIIHIGKYSIVNRTIKLWKKLPKEALVTFSCRSYNFKKRARELIVCELK